MHLVTWLPATVTVWVRETMPARTTVTWSIVTGSSHLVRVSARVRARSWARVRAAARLWAMAGAKARAGLRLGPGIGMGGDRRFRAPSAIDHSAMVVRDNDPGAAVRAVGTDGAPGLG